MTNTDLPDSLIEEKQESQKYNLETFPTMLKRTTDYLLEFVAMALTHLAIRKH